MANNTLAYILAGALSVAPVYGADRDAEAKAIRDAYFKQAMQNARYSRPCAASYEKTTLSTSVKSSLDEKARMDVLEAFWERIAPIKDILKDSKAKRK